MRIALQDKLVLRYEIKVKILKCSQVGFRDLIRRIRCCDIADQMILFVDNSVDNMWIMRNLSTYPQHSKKSVDNSKKSVDKMWITNFDCG